jgi:hypothetical protein
MDTVMSPADRRAKHKAWVASFGLSDEDRRRIQLLAADVTDRGSPPALVDLSVPVRVAAIPASSYRSGPLLGTLTRRDGMKVALLVWRMDDHEHGLWAKRRAAL